jgi:hypothetical protein
LHGVASNSRNEERNTDKTQQHITQKDPEHQSPTPNHNLEFSVWDTNLEMTCQVGGCIEVSC